MKTKTRVLAALGYVLIVFSLLAGNSAAAITMTSITEEEYNTTVTENATAWVARFQAGGDSGQQELSHEIFLSANAVEYGEHVWSYPEEVSVSYDASGNIYATAGMTTIDVQPILAFNTILMKVYDSPSSRGSMNFENGMYNAESIQNFNVDNSVEYLMIFLGETNPEFVLTGDFNATMTGFDNAYVEMQGVNMNTVPEPSSWMILIPMAVIPLFRCRR